MKFYILLIISIISGFGVFTTNVVSAEVDTLSNIEFMQTGLLYTSENEFQISDEITIREFFNENIIRVSGQTIEGFSYVTYSKILKNDEINTRGMIFINGQFVNLKFEEKIIQKETSFEKNNDILILTKYTQRVYSKDLAAIEIKIFDKQQNNLNNFYQNFGHVSDVNTMITVIDEEGKEVFSSNGTTNERGFFGTEFLILDNSKKETLTVTINVENEVSKATKVLQIFSLGAEPQNDS